MVAAAGTAAHSYLVIPVVAPGARLCAACQLWTAVIAACDGGAQTSGAQTNFRHRGCLAEPTWARVHYCGAGCRGSCSWQEPERQ